MKQYIVTGMTCAACQAHVEKAVGELKDVDSVSVSGIPLASHATSML